MVLPLLLLLGCCAASVPSLDGVDMEAWERQLELEYSQLQQRFHSEWRKTKGSDLQALQPTSREHKWILYAQVACTYNQAANATFALRAAVARQPTMLAAHRMLAKIQLGQGHFEAASRSLQQMIQLSPENTEALLLLQYLEQQLQPASVSSHAKQLRVALKRKLGEMMPHMKSKRVLRIVRKFCDANNVSLLQYNDGNGGLARAQADFKRDRYVSLVDMLPETHTALLKELYSELLDDPELLPGARFVQQNRRWEFESEPFSTLINYQLTELIAAITQRAVVPTYVFPVIYEAGGNINPHRDVQDNYFSVTYTAVASGGPSRSSSMVFVDTPSNDINLDNPDTRLANVPSELNMGTLYIGPEIVHWRTPVPDGIKIAQIIFGFRPVDPDACVSQ